MTMRSVNLWLCVCRGSQLSLILTASGKINLLEESTVGYYFGDVIRNSEVVNAID